MLEKTLSFQPSLYVGSGPLFSEYRQGAISELLLQVDGTYTGTPANLADDAPWSLLGRVELDQNGPRIAADAGRLYHLSSFLLGGYSQRTAQVSANGFFASRMRLPLARLIPGCGLDSSAIPVAWKGTWQPASYYAGTAPTTVVGTTQFRAQAISAPNAPPGGFRDPNITEANVKLESAIKDNSLKIDFRSDVLLPGIMLFAYDVSAGFGTAPRARVDGLIRRVTLERQLSGAQREIIVDNIPWGTLRAQTLELMGGNSTDEAASAGVVWIPLREPSRPAELMASFWPAGSSMTLTFDTVADVEGGFTAVTPAAGDNAVVLLPQVYSRAKALNAAGGTAVQTTARAAAGSRF